MSLYFDDATSEVVDMGSPALLDDLPDSTFSGCAWIRNDTDGYNQVIMGKGVWATRGWSFFLDGQAPFSGDVYGGHRLYVLRNGNVSSSVAQGPINAVELDTWTFVAFSYDPSGTPQIELYHGALGGTLVNTTLASEDVGSGNYDSDAGDNFQVGQQTTGNGYRGDIARCAVFTGLLTLDDFQTIFNASVAQWHRTGVVGIWDLHGTGTQPDLSGNANNGTVTNATASSHVPLGPPFGFDISMPYIVAAAGGLSIPIAAYHYNHHLR